MRVMATQLIAALHKTIEDLSEDFRGEGAFSFATEADVQSTLLGRLRANVLFNVRVGGIRIELVHAEFPAFGTSWKGGPRYDVTIWHPNFAQEAQKNWGTPVRRWPDQLQKKLNLIAIEIERFSGLPWDIRQYEMFSPRAQEVLDKKIGEHADIRKLRESSCEFGYFLIFWDDDVQEKPDLKVCFQSMHKACANLAVENGKLRFACVCRDGSMFTIPELL
jgi:hypothetical protein